VLSSISYQSFTVGCWTLNLERAAWALAVTAVRPLCCGYSHPSCYLQMKNGFIDWRGFGPPLLMYHVLPLPLQPWQPTEQLRSTAVAYWLISVQAEAAVLSSTVHVHSVLSGCCFANPCCGAAVQYTVPPYMNSPYALFQEFLDTSLQYCAATFFFVFVPFLSRC